MKLIYLVEPHADTAMLETDLLQDAGFSVRVVSAEAASAALEGTGMGLLLVAAGPRDGAAAETLLAKATRANVPVIVTTTGRANLDRWRAAAAMLLKPFSFEELVARVREHFAAG